MPPIALSAVTLATHDMRRAVDFYHALGFEDVAHASDDFVSFRLGGAFLNLVAMPEDRRWSWWGRVILHVPDVDAQHRRALAGGLRAQSEPRDAPWGERYFHITDPDGHELSFATPLR